MPLVLIVDDEPDFADSLGDLLGEMDYRACKASTLKKAAEILAEVSADGILLDLDLPDGSGLDWIPRLREQHPHLAVIVITGAADNVPTAVEAMRRGADQFLTKPVNPDQLKAVIRQCMELERLKKRDSARRRLAKDGAVFMGDSGAARRMWDMAATAAANDSVLIIQGETGSGKGVLARWIHENSGRGSEGYVEVNCSSLGGDLLASELFGHRKGAFTSAVEDREGLIEIADSSTLFLDEIGDMALPVQTQLLKVIEEKRFRRVGETRTRSSDFRLICASNKDLKQEVEAKRFREDLYYRIHVFPIHVPPLRDRPGDLIAMSRHILAQFGRADDGLPPGVEKLVLGYPWPGNVRELRNVLERACLLAQSQALAIEHFTGIRDAGGAQECDSSKPGAYNLESHEASHISRTFRAFDGDVNLTACMLGISRATLYRKLKKYGLSANRI